MADFPRSYTCRPTFGGTASSNNSIVFDLGFQAASLVLFNENAANTIYANFLGVAEPSTTDYWLAACERLTLSNFPIPMFASVSARATSTSATSILRVLALGGV